MRTMIQISKTEQILKEVIQYNIDVTAISETRWLGSGMEPLEVARSSHTVNMKEDAKQVWVY